MSTPARPVPVPDERSKAYWDACAHHILSAARCSACEQLTLPPDITCPHCGSADPQFTFSPVSGRAHVRSWTVMRQSFQPGFARDVPFVLVDVELIEQPELRLIGRLVDGVDAVFQIGAPVRVVFEDVAPSVAIPAFALAEST